MERWMPCLGWEGLYEVSDHGRVRSLDRQIVVKDPRGRMGVRRYKGRFLRCGVGSHGYRGVCFTAPGRPRETHCIHVLVARHFVPGEAPGLEVCHEDGNKLNCHFKNLRWDTRQNNALDRHKHGTVIAIRGEASRAAKLTDEKVRWLRSPETVGISSREIARRWGVSHHIVANARAGRSWTHVD